ncbi:MAG: NlpC/P60 family protein [Terriglobales bacterium]
MDLALRRYARRVCLAALLLCAGMALAADAQFVVVQPVANMYSAASLDADVVSQAIYATNVVAIEEQDEWVKVRTPGDDYLGWMARSALKPLGGTAPYASGGNTVEVRNLAAHIYREADVTAHAPLITVPFETRLEVAAGPKSKRWLQVRLPDGRLGWIQQGDVVAERKPMSIAQTIAFARRFLGLPYTWGGRSSFGYDCSGFMQMLMRQRGYQVPRDAQPQAEWTGSRTISRKQLHAGDLLYFGGPGKITHTGMYIGNGKFIHATTNTTPVVQISRLTDQPWTKILVLQRRVK